MPLYSEEVQDIMGRIPGRILSVGLTVIFGIMLMLVVGSYFFQSSQVVSCPVKLTTINPPQELLARSSGMIEQLKIKEHEHVKVGQLIAVIQNTANYKDVCVLENWLEELNMTVIWDSAVLERELPRELVVGEMQSAYIRLYKAWNNFRRYKEQNYLPMKIGLQRQQIVKQQIDYWELCRQEKLQKCDFELTEKQFQRDSLFFQHYKDATSIVDYEKKQQAYLQKKVAYMNFCTLLREAGYEKLKQDNQLIDLEIQYEKESNAYRQELDEAYQLLVATYRQWREKYMLVSNIDGIITLTGVWSDKQVVAVGERVATIVPLEDTKIVGRAFIQMNGIGKVKKGQNVNIKLNGFPYMEFGMLKGVVGNVSLVPEKDKGYVAEIFLTEGMRSSYREQLKFIQGLEGTVEIITQKERWLKKLINPLRVKLNE